MGQKRCIARTALNFYEKEILKVTTPQIQVNTNTKIVINNCMFKTHRHLFPTFNVFITL